MPKKTCHQLFEPDNKKLGRNKFCFTRRVPFYVFKADAPRLPLEDANSKA